MNRGRKSKIVLLTGNSLCHNPRALKEALALARAGHEVSVLGAWFDAAFKARDLRLIESIPFEFIPVLDFTVSGIGSAATRFVRRASKKAADVAHGLTGHQSPRQLGLGINRLVRQALRIDADLYIAHSESGLYVGWKLLRHGCRVGVDMEDWFSEDLLPEARRHRPLRLLQSLEKQLLLQGAYATCPSQAMSEALAGEHGCRFPTVIYNAFGWSERQTMDGKTSDRRNRDIPSVHWYSTTLGPGRGLEDLVAAIPLLVQDVEIHLRGNPTGGFEAWVTTHVPECWREKIVFHPLVTNDQLLSRIAEHDIGFAGEMNYCLNKELTISNKILHYLLGGLAVIASDTTGQREVARQAPEAVLLYPSGNARALAGVLNSLLASPECMRLAKAAALVAAQETFCWERQEDVLLDAITHALGTTRSGNPVLDLRAMASESGARGEA
jgi:glycosyltransferase involved in cell wall biosynthesis